MWNKKYQRRRFLTGAGLVALGLIALPHLMGGRSVFAKSSSTSFPFALTDAEWKKRLSPEAYYVLRQHGTERSGSSALNTEKRTGTFRCAGCEWPLYSSSHKYESGTGWPSFFQPLSDQAVGTTTDYFLLYPRTEVHCANCGGHLGHVFDDGPEPTGKRYCMNGVAMAFVPA